MVCCVVGTSVIWVVIIYQTRKRSLDGGNMSSRAHLHLDDNRYHHHTEPPTVMFLDNVSEHSSKDSGTGDSAKRSNEELIINATSKSSPRSLYLVQYSV